MHLTFDEVEVVVDIAHTAVLILICGALVWTQFVIARIFKEATQTLRDALGDVVAQTAATQRLSERLAQIEAELAERKIDA